MFEVREAGKAAGREQRGQCLKEERAELGCVRQGDMTDPDEELYDASRAYVPLYTLQGLCES